MTVDTWTALFGVLLLWGLAWRLRSPKTRQALLLIASYLFYVSWGLDFLLVLIASSLLNYICGSILRHRPSPARLSIGIALNLLILGFFKFLPPLLDGAPVGLWQSDILRQIVMPVGISFWTFQGLSYLLDVYREEELDPSLLEFCLYMAFWPTVLSGPVCRLPSMLPQFRAAVGFSRDNFYAGARRVIQGLWMKMVLAQILGFGLRPGEGVIGGFDQVQEEWGGVDVWLLAIGFGFQLFFDFAGYSHMVIGTARIFGIRLAENFDRPYFSTTPSIFWTRWHMSLSFWIRDYVFLPLASSLRDRRWPYVALVLSMALFGLWHGAKATLILWGIYHGLLLVLHRLGQQLKRWLTVAQSTHLGTVMSWCATFSLVSLGWIFFRAHDLGQALTMLRAVLSPSNYYQFALPGSLYVLISSVVISYFLYEMLGPIVDRLRASYREELINYRQTRSTPSLPSAGFMLGKGCDFLAERKWWWATPMLAGFAAFCSLAIFHQNSPVTPFMYTLF